MDRREFLKYSPALPAAAAVTLSVKTSDGEERIGYVGVLRLRPGDVLAVFCPYPLSKDSSYRIQAIVEKMVPDGVKVAVFTDGFSLGVLRPELK